MREEGTNHKFYMAQGNEIVEVPSPITTESAIPLGLEKLLLEERIERLYNLLQAREKQIKDLEIRLDQEKCRSEKASRSLENTRVWRDYYKRKPGWFMGPIAYLAWLVTRPRDVPCSDDR